MKQHYQSESTLNSILLEQSSVLPINLYQSHPMVMFSFDIVPIIVEIDSISPKYSIDHFEIHFSFTYIANEQCSWIDNIHKMCKTSPIRILQDRHDSQAIIQGDLPNHIDFFLIQMVDKTF